MAGVTAAEVIVKVTGIVKAVGVSSGEEPLIFPV